jgi:iron complex transport system substrate-binding protein
MPSRGPRVVSLLPSATETLCLVGGQDLLVGRSHECDFPDGLAHLPILTAPKIHATSPSAIDAAVSAALGDPAGPQSLYELFADRLAALAPDVILTQDLCEVCSIDLGTVRRIAEKLPNRPEIVSLNPTTVEGMLDDVTRVARAIGQESAGRDCVVQLRERLYYANEFVNPFDDGPVVAFLEWTDPLFCAGHWTVQLIERAGAQHPWNPTMPKADAGAATGPQSGERIADKSKRMPAELLVAGQPQWLVVCPCGMNLDATRECVDALSLQPWWHELPAVKNDRVALVDGNQYFNRPGPRLVDAYEWLVGWLQGRPELMPKDFAWLDWSDRKVVK